MTVHLLNSAMAPRVNGVYRWRTISLEEFGQRLNAGLRSGELKNYIGYGDNLRLLREQFGVNLQTSREQARIQFGDYLLVMRLKYRVANPGEKAGEVQHSISDFEFGFASYRER